MFTWLNFGKSFIFVFLASMAMLATPAFSEDIGTLSSGTWENPAIWTSDTVPTSADNVYIGSTYPNSPQATGFATVTLSASESASNVSVGYGSPTNGVLDLGANQLTIAGALRIGLFGGLGSIQEEGGSFTAGTVMVFTSGNSLTMGTSDVTGSIDIENGGILTTSSTGNLTGGGAVANGATLNLGADMNLSSSTGLNTESTGATTTLNLNGHNLTAPNLALGYYLTSAVTLNRGSGTQGTLTLNNLQIGNGQNLTLIAGDVISGTPGAVDIYSGATLTTSSTSNITTTVNVVDSTFNLGADLGIGNQTVNVANGSTLNLAGHNLAASYLLLGFSGTSTVTLNRGSGTPGTLTLGNLFLGNGQNLNLISTDTISNGSNGVNVENGATLTTAATSNISKNDVNVTTGGTMNLSASLDLSGSNNLNVQDAGSVFNAQGNSVTAGKIFVGSSGSAAVTVSNLGTVIASELHVGNGSALDLHGGDTISSVIDVEGGSMLTVHQSLAGTGLTLSGTLTSSLTIDAGSVSKMDLIFTAPVSAQDWAFRWADPDDSTNWVDTLTTMIDDGQIDLTLPEGENYSVVDSNGYTYVEVIPEPSCLALMGLGFAVLGVWRVRRRVRLAHSNCL
ncbi:MAG: PEP-CTERM sorting domain-containing protein [Chthoniobacteraceae bacterium]